MTREQEENMIEDVSLLMDEKDVFRQKNQKEETGDASGEVVGEGYPELMDQEDVSGEVHGEVEGEGEATDEMVKKDIELFEMIYEQVKVDEASVLDGMDEMKPLLEDVSQLVDQEEVVEDEPMDEEKNEDASEFMVQEEDVEDICEQSLEDCESEAVEIEKEECVAEIKLEAVEKEFEAVGIEKEECVAEIKLEAVEKEFDAVEIEKEECAAEMKEDSSTKESGVIEIEKEECAAQMKANADEQKDSETVEIEKKDCVAELKEEEDEKEFEVIEIEKEDCAAEMKEDANEKESGGIEIQKEECAAEMKEEVDEQKEYKVVEIIMEEDTSNELNKEDEKDSAKLAEKEEIHFESEGKVFKPVLKAYAVKVSKPVNKANKSEDKTSKPVVKAEKLIVKTDAESDSTKLGEQAEEKATSSFLANTQRKIETTNNLPSGWKRVAVLRIAGKHAGRYDTILISDTNFKMRSYPNVVKYLTDIGKQHLLEDKSYDFKFKQPFTPERKQTPTTTRAPPSKQTTPVSSKKSEPTKVSGSKSVVMHLKRKVPAFPSDESDRKSSEWEITDPPGKPKAMPQKKTTLALEKDKLKISPYFLRKRPEKIATETGPVSKFKSVLSRIPSTPKKMKEVKDTSPVKENKSHSDVGRSNDSCEQGDSVTETAKEVVCAVDARVARTESCNDDIQFEECSSEASTVFEINSANSKFNNSKSRKRSSVDSEHSLKQPLSESDQNASASKKARLCNDID